MRDNIINNKRDELIKYCSTTLKRDTDEEIVLVNYVEVSGLSTVILTHLPKKNGVALLGHVYSYTVEAGDVTAFWEDARSPKEHSLGEFRAALYRALGEYEDADM